MGGQETFRPWLWVPARQPRRARDARGAFDVERALRRVSERSLVHDDNPRAPRLDLRAAQPIPSDAAAWGPWIEYGVHARTPDEAEHLARVRAEEIAATRHVISRKSTEMALRAGATVVMVDDSGDEQDLLITRVVFRSHLLGEAGEAEDVGAPGEGSPGGERTWHTELTAIPREIAYRPPRLTLKPRIAGLVHAVIDGELKGPYAELDEAGRYRVRFGYDLSGRTDLRASPLVRMLQPHAGPRYGMHFPLRPGTEVMIAFVEGDPDRPATPAGLRPPRPPRLIAGRSATPATGPSNHRAAPTCPAPLVTPCAARRADLWCVGAPMSARSQPPPDPTGRGGPSRPGQLIVGIDLGTTHTVVAWADPADPAGEPRVLAIPQLVTATEIDARPLLPSFLYAPIDGEAPADPWGDAPWILGDMARRRGGEVPGRLVSSSKSWLCHPGVDRAAPILPWGAPEDAVDLPRLSPLDAATRVLSHVRRAWDDALPEHPLADQHVVLTVPASFDEVARELTLEAARRAGLAVRLLEEPQAAFYDHMRRAGDPGLQALLDRAPPEGALVLVCDVGGGTTDLSLIRVARGDGARPFEVSRVAVGRHLLLGGDNMDLALAHLCEPRLVGDGARLSPPRFGQLVLACRAAKERLLGGDLDGHQDDAEPPEDAPITLLSQGARLLGGSLTTRLSRDEAARVVLDGFFPPAPRDARPERARGALLAFGLPYEKDVAITRHVASFFARHAPEVAGPAALLLNGGVFRARRIAERLASAIQAWGGPPLQVLPHADPDLAVARGAVAFGLSLSGRGVRIEGGAARGYYVGLDAPAAGGPRPAICVVPRGAREGTAHVAAGRTLALVVGRPVRFDLFASDVARLDRAGDVIALDDDRFEALPPVAVEFETGRGSGAETRVALEGELTAVGTLDLACVEVGVDAPRRFRLAFQLRGGAAMRDVAPREGRAGPRPGGRRLDEAREAIERVFGKGRADVAPREVKGLVRELERVLGDRSSWTTETARALFDALVPSARSRRRSADHERVFWSLAGYCLRPGFGDPGDRARVAAVAPLLGERLSFAQEPRSWQQFWIAWRRIAGGLDEATQQAIRELADPFLAPSERRLKKPKGVKPEALDELLELTASLERVPAPRRSELGGWVLERTWTSRDPRLWAAIGRIGARVPAYASVHHVVSPPVAERWIDHLLREKWEGLPTAAAAAVQLSRGTGDRARDVDERVRGEVARRLVKVGAEEAWIRAVREVVAVEEADRAAFFGEGLPVGLRLLEG